MDIAENTTHDGDQVIDLTAPAPEELRGHRLTELVQALTGCSPERAELAVDDPFPTPLEEDDALTALAAAMVRVRNRQPAH